MKVTKNSVKKILIKWQDILRLRDWDITVDIIRKKWRKSGDVKVDLENRKAVLLINHKPKCLNLEEIVVHELLHIKLYGLDQMSEDLTWNSPLLAAWVKYNTPSPLTGEGRPVCPVCVANATGRRAIGTGRGEGEIESKIPRPLRRGGSFNILYGKRKTKKRQFAWNQFMSLLETTVEDITKGYLSSKRK